MQTSMIRSHFFLNALASLIIVGSLESLRKTYLPLSRTVHLPQCARIIRAHTKTANEDLKSLLFLINLPAANQMALSFGGLKFVIMP